MHIGMIGLGRMGANMAARLVRGGHTVTGFDPAKEARERVVAAGAGATGSLEELVAALEAPRALWIMVPAGAPVDGVLDALLPALAPGDVLVDGGNSWYRDTMRRADKVAAAGVHWVDAGTSGGVWGLEEGYSLMLGGSDEALRLLRPALETLAPAPDRGWGHVGPSGAGHFVKMVHNAIEYGMMQAFAEGFEMMAAKEEMALDLAQVGRVWQHGSVVRSWLLDLTVAGLEENPSLEGIAPWVSDSGEGRWAVAEAIDLDVPAPVITLALQARLRSRVENSYADRMLAMLRNQFGGHAVRSSTPS